MGMTTGRRGGPVAEINVTPMADVVIVLVIIFMVAVSALGRDVVVLPPALRTLVQAGAPDADGWTLLAPHNAAAAKLRQLAPALLAALDGAGHPVNAIRVKVLRSTP